MDTKKNKKITLMIEVEVEEDKNNWIIKLPEFKNNQKVRIEW